MRRFFPAIIALGTLGAFYNSLAGVFVFDDRLHILENVQIRSLHPFWGPLLHTSRPFVQWTLALNYAVSGLAPWSYHVFNALIHVAAALTLFGIARHALRRVSSLSAAADELAMVISLLWAVHPLQTESVTYIIQRGESMMGLFCLVVIYSGIRSTKSPLPARWYVCGILACVLGLASKPVMAIAPLLMLMFDRTFLAGSFRTALRDRRGFYIGLALSLLFLPLFLAGRLEEWKTTAGFDFAHLTPLQYARTQPGVIFRYFRLALWPDSLCLDYDWSMAARLPIVIVYSAGIVLLVGASLFCLLRKPSLGFLGAWFFLALAPTSSFVPIADVIFEHRMYLPLAAVIAMAVISIFRLVEIVPLAPNKRHLAYMMVTGIIAITLVGRTIVRNDEYASPITLWTSATETSPRSARAHYSLGVVLAERQSFELARAHFLTAIAIRPDYPEAHYNLGNAFLAQHLPADAIPCFRKAIALEPGDAQMHNNLGVALLCVNDPVAATTQFDQALLLDPSNASAHFNRAKVAKDAGEYELAVRNFNAAIGLRPDWIEARRELALLTLR
jgi:Tfp pilus assembly protein PilF